jgi:hypothetical protein
MSLDQIQIEGDIDYAEMKRLSVVITERFNTFLLWKTSLGTLESKPAFKVADLNARLSLPDLTKLLARIEALKA